MLYCINPNCPQRQNPDTAIECQACHTTLLIENRYRLVRPLRALDRAHPYTEIFEVEDIKDNKTLKVLKILIDDFTQLVELFEQEANILIDLIHPGIPKAEAQFSVLLSNGQELRCLVMERIKGQNLEQWLEHNGPISQEQALEWMQQLAKILDYVHQNQLFHRDIKPSNIILKPDGQLVLIDFGTARRVTQTVIDGRNVTIVCSDGYTAPEQIEGRAVPQSDFFALGRTFVHLLTGKHPHDIPRNPQTGNLIWRDSKQLTSGPLADLINQLMARSPQNRPRNSQKILQRLKEIKQPYYIWLSLRHLVIGAAVLVGAAGSYGSYWYLTGVGGCSKIWLRHFPLGDSLSCGEEILDKGYSQAEKKEGVKTFAAANYSKAVSLLDKAWQQRHDPETLIYLNNARLMEQKAYAIAVVAPISSNRDMAMEILRGVAQAQDEINHQENKINGRGLKVLIADDANNPAQAKQIASELVAKRDILAVVSHYASEVTQAAMDIYKQHKLAMISPTSTSEDLSIFRTVPSDRATAPKLADYLINNVRQQKAAIFYNPQSIYSRSLRDQFRKSFLANKGQVVEEFDLSDALFKADAAINQAHKQGAEALVLLPDSLTSRNAFPNAMKVFKANQGRYWMVGGDSLYSNEILQLGTQDAVKRLVVATPWHSLISPNREFPKVAQELWKGEVSWRTAFAYDATRVLITALKKQPQPHRNDVQQVLEDTKFETKGATGVIHFGAHGDRFESNIQLVKIVPSNSSDYGYLFVPINSSIR